MAQVILSLGTNMGDRLGNLIRALDLLATQVGRIQNVSDVYETEPWGFEARQWFLNIAIAVETDLHPFTVLRRTQTIEKLLGRRSKSDETGGYQSRTMDIDIIFFDQKIIKTTELSIPHPLMHQRNFVLQPVADIAPDFVHPLLHVTVSELLSQCKDKTQVRFFAKADALKTRVYID